MEQINRYTERNKSALLYGPGDIRIVEMPVEEIKHGEVLVKIGAATTCGTDIKTVKRGGHPKIMPTLPSPLGHEMAGTVVETGHLVDAVKVGDRVVVSNSAPCHECFYCEKGEHNLCENIRFINGAFAQYIRLPERFVRYSLYKIPDELDLKETSLSEPVACVLHACEKLKIREGETVCIVGTGSMAFLLLQVLRARGARPILVGRNPEKLKNAFAFGAESVIQSTIADPAVEVSRLTGGHGADAAIEAVGLPQTWEQAVSLVRKGGRVCFFGGCVRGSRVNLDTFKLHYEEISTFGVFHFTPADMRQAIQLLAEKKINTSLFLGREKRLEDLNNVILGKDCDEALKFPINPWT